VSEKDDKAPGAGANDPEDLGAAVGDAPLQTFPGEEVPEELADLVLTGDEPATGLVSEFRELKPSQAAWLVGNRDTQAVAKSPLFIVAVLVIALGVLAALIVGFNQAKASSGGGDASEKTLAMMGVKGQEQMAEQQLGMKVLDVESVQAAQDAVREGKADAAYIQDQTTGTSSFIALDQEPSDIIDKLSPKPSVTLLNAPAVSQKLATPVLWGLVALTIIAFLSLGQAVYQTLRLEKRSRISEVMAAAVPVRSIARGRVTGALTPALIYILLAYVILLLGMSILGYSQPVVKMLPGLGWGLTVYLAAALVFPSLYLWAGSLSGRRSTKVFYLVTGVLVVVGAFLPMFFAANSLVLKVLGYIPLTAPVAIPKLYLSGQTDWWVGLVSLVIAVVVGLVLRAMASAAYEKNLLAGTGRSGKLARARKSKKLTATAKDRTGAAAKESAADDAADAAAEEPEAK
jgi:ABC-2 type transport system permease protein